jgi:ankyrin repeat protein
MPESNFNEAGAGAGAITAAERAVREAAERKERAARAQEAFDGVMGEIIASGRSASTWFGEKSAEEKQRILKILYDQGDLRVSIKKTGDNYEPLATEVSIGGHDNIAALLPAAEGEVKSITVSTYDEDTGEVGSKTISINKRGDKYYQVEGGKEIELKIEGAAINRVDSFEQELDTKFISYQRENDLDAAIAAKDFGLINRIIKNGFKVSDEQIIKLMRLSKAERAGDKEYTPTFLHKLLDPTTGISDSQYIKPLLERTKSLLNSFEYEQLVSLTDGIKPARELFTGKLRRLLPPTEASVRSDIDTHQMTVHASVDLSAARLYERFRERNEGVVPAPTSTERGKVTIARSAAFKGLVDGKVQALKEKIDSWLGMTDEQLAGLMERGQTGKSVADLRFELGAAKRLVDDCITKGYMHAGHYRVGFNEPVTNGLTPKEILAMAYDALSDDDKLAFTGGGRAKDDDRISHFTKLVTHLYEAKREYNQGSREGEDLNKCTGGTVNHIVYSLQGVYSPSVVDVAYVTPDVIKQATNEETSKVLQRYLADAAPADKEGLRVALARWQFGAKLGEVLSAELMARLRTDIVVSIRETYGKYYRDESYLAASREAFPNSSITKELSQSLGEVKYSDILSAEQMVDAMEQGKLPLYTRTGSGYRLTLDILREKEPEYYSQVAQRIIDRKEYESLSSYQIRSSEVSNKLIEKLAEQAETADNAEAAKERSGIMGYFLQSSDRTSLEAARELVGEEKFKDWVRHNLRDYPNISPANIMLMEGLWPGMMRSEEVIELFDRSIEKNRTLLSLYLIGKMSPEDIAKQDKDGNTALMHAIGRGDKEIALALIAKMSSEDVVKPNLFGGTALMLAVDEDKEIALALIERMSPEDIAKQDKGKHNALMFAIGSRKEIALALIDKMRPEDFAKQTRYGNTALTFAVINGDKEIALALIAKMNPEDLAKQTQDGNTALILAAASGHKEIVLALIAKMNPEDLTMQNKHGDTALILAAGSGHKEIALALIAKMNPEDLAKQTQDGNTALMAAAGSGHKEIALALIAKMNPEDLTMQNKHGDTALILAAASGHKEIALVLIEKINQRLGVGTLAIPDKNGRTALIHAVMGGHKELAAELIEKMEPKDLTMRDSSGKSALIHAVMGGHKELAAELIEKINVRDLAIQDNEKHTALMHAVMGGHKDLALALIKKMEAKGLAIGDLMGIPLRTVVNKIEVDKEYKNIALVLIERMDPEDVNKLRNDRFISLRSISNPDYREIASAINNKILFIGVPDEVMSKIVAKEKAGEPLNKDIVVQYLSKKDESGKTNLDKIKDKELREVALRFIQDKAKEQQKRAEEELKKISSKFSVIERGKLNRVRGVLERAGVKLSTRLVGTQALNKKNAGRVVSKKGRI